MNLMEGLVTFENGLTPTPALARSWNISPDGKTYTFHLRTDVKWSDGVPLKAQDFVYSWKRLLAPFTGAAYSYILYDIVGAEDFSRGRDPDFSKVGISAPDASTFVVKLKYPLSYWIDILAFWVTFPLRQDIVEKHGNSWATPGRMVTLGPYCLVSHDTDSNVILRKNVFYYGHTGNVDRVTALMIKDDTVALQMYESGKLDFVSDLAAVDLKKLAERKDLRRFENLKTGYITFLPDRFPVSNIHLRKAIAQGLNKQALVKSLYGGQVPATSFVPPPMMGYSKKIGLPFDLKKARSERELAGLVGQGMPINLDFIYPNWDKDRIIAEFIRDELKRNLNIDVQLRGFDNQTFRNQLDLKINPVYSITWTADFPDPHNFLSVFQSTSGNGRTSWVSESYDQAVAAAQISRDPATRAKTYFDLQKQLIEDEVVIIPLYYEPNLALVNPRVNGFQLSAMDYLYLRNVNVRP
ncbi:MAG: peptide ABC transporter substrate-binding protein [Bdellovibrio sp.]|nr:peptide ABC transporter substrate-binding protein [Bdellovibrio sp.]